MKKLMYYCLVCFILIALSCKSQNDFDKLIIGCWKGVNMQRILSNVTPFGKPYENYDAFCFKKNGKRVDYSRYPTIDSGCVYTIIKDELTICKWTHYIIEKLNEKELIIREYNGKDRNGGGYRCYFIKVENREDLIKFENNIGAKIQESAKNKYNLQINENKTEAEPDIWTVVEKMPEFPNGNNAMKEFFKNNLKKPDSFKGEGNVYLTFVIEKDGEITDIRLLRSLSPECDAEAIRVIKLMPKWIPGEQNGKKVRVQWNIPVKF